MFNRNIIGYLNVWKSKKNRKPLVLRGARQVGKTCAVKLFGQKYFDDLVYINLDNNEHYELFKDIKSLSDFEKTVEIVLKKRLQPGGVLVFIDEIQNIPDLIALLRFFYEERPSLPVIAAGSLLEAKIKTEGLSMPVGRIEYAYLYPLTFFEFLEAKKEDKLLDFLKQIRPELEIPSSIHTQALNLFYEYTLIGGMPEAVSLHTEHAGQQEINTLYSSLATGYAEDVYKYASRANVKYIRHILENAPYFAGERITYEKFGQSQYRSREMSEAFEVLEKTMVVYQVHGTKSNELPLVAQKKRARKLIYLDSGFVNFKNNIQANYVKLHDLNGLFRGKIAEQIVGQNILSHFMHVAPSLYYWAKEKPMGSAEVDFCLSYRDSVLGIEVKSGHPAKLKSLFSFAQNMPDHRLIRIYSGPLKKESVAKGQYQLLSVPFYLVNRIFSLTS